MDDVAGFAKTSAGLPMYAVGSGGSLSAAALASALHRQTGAVSACLTPLEFLELDDLDARCAVLAVTAGGNNADILAAFERAAALSPEVLGVICANQDGKLVHNASKLPGVWVHAATPPTGKDGFLATNSLLVTGVWLAMAYADAFSCIPPLPDTAEQLLYREESPGICGNYDMMSNVGTVMVLYDTWGKPAAMDVESKLHEAGLAGVQLADYRNFAHGRHNWLDKNGEQTGMICMVTPRSSRVAAKTLDMIPDRIPVVRLETTLDGPAASLNLMVRVMHLVKFFGDVRGMDPGRPQVAAFGRKMYRMRVPVARPGPSERELAILYRKLPDKVSVDALRRFVRRVERAKFGGILLNYDGVVRDPREWPCPSSIDLGMRLSGMIQSGIMVGVATGRGRSVRAELRKIIAQEHWRKFLVGYYNGAEIGFLDDDTKPDLSLPTDRNLRAFLDDIRNRGIIPPDHTVDMRPRQISIMRPTIPAQKIISAMSHAPEFGVVQVVQSDHSIDVIPYGTSKLNLLDRMLNMAGDYNMPVLCIGDQGRWPGSDHALLNTPYSLSVNYVSGDADSCWNTLPSGVGGATGTLEYVKGIRTFGDRFMMCLGVNR